MLPAIEGHLRGDRLRPVFLMEAVRTRVVKAEELRAADPDLRTLRNLNTHEDYLQALGEAGFGPVLSRGRPQGRPPLRDGPTVGGFGVARPLAGWDFLWSRSSSSRA